MNEQTDILGDEQVAEIQNAWEPTRPTTHWAGCYTAHYSCAIALLLMHAAALQARLDAVEQERREGLSLDKVAEYAVEAFRRQAIEAVRALSDNQLNRTAICARLELLSTEGREGNG